MSAKPSQALREARAEIASLKASVLYYIAKAETAWKEAQEQRERRLALEEEIPFMNLPSGLRMRPRPISRTITIEVPVEVPRHSADGPFGRIGDRIDRFFNGKR